MPDNWGICWLEQLLYCLTNCVGWEDILARDCRVVVCHDKFWHQNQLVTSETKSVSQTLIIQTV